MVGLRGLELRAKHAVAIEPVSRVATLRPAPYHLASEQLCATLGRDAPAGTINPKHSYCAWDLLTVLPQVRLLCVQGDARSEIR